MIRQRIGVFGLDDDHRDVDRISAAREALEPFLVDDEELRFREIEAVADLVFLPPPVEGHRACAEADGGPEREQPLEAVGPDDAHAVTGADAVLLRQRGRDRTDHAQVLGVGQRPAVVEVDVLLVAERGRRLEHRAQMQWPVLEHLDALAEHGFFDDLERCTRRGEPRGRFLVCDDRFGHDWSPLPDVPAGGPHGARVRAS